jgi:uncharacterized protein YacL (UPF0231 family)
MNKLRFYRDQEHAPRAVGSDEHSIQLAQLLESDIQDDAVACRELLDSIHQLPQQNGRISRTGNSFNITLTPQRTTLRRLSLETGENYILDTSRVEQALQEWLNFIT